MLGEPMPADRRARRLTSLRDEDAKNLGDEARWLARLQSHGIPLAQGWLLDAGDGAEARVAAALGEAFALAARVQVRAWVAWSGPFRPRRAHADGEWLGRNDDPAPAIARVLEEARALFSDRVYVRVVALDDAPTGVVSSADPDRGDPDVIDVSIHGRPSVQLDRRTMRQLGDVVPDDFGLVSRVADLADRSQLALGRPLQLEWVHLGGRVVVAGVSPLSLVARFAGASYRRVALVESDEGLVAPLAIDAMDLALAHEDPVGEPRVRRVYGRAYRRADGRSTRASTPPPPALGRFAARVAQLAGDVTSPLTGARQLTLDVAERSAQLDRLPLRMLDDTALLSAFRDAERIVVDALVLLDRARLATLATVPPIESVVGPLPREAFGALAAPRWTRERRRAYERLTKLAQRVHEERGRLAGPDGFSPALRRRWDDARQKLAHWRVLSLDVQPPAWGEDDASLLDALATHASFGEDSREKARRDAVRRLRATARALPFGAGREAVVGSVTLLLSRLADARGAICDALCAGQVRLRRAALEVGRRLVERGVLDAAVDALYMSRAEVEEALGGEPGAYAARVRLRREDDQRWANFEAPRRLYGG